MVAASCFASVSAGLSAVAVGVEGVVGAVGAALEAE
jgi:hypothetical protein